MPPMSLEVKLATIVAIVLLAVLIAAYHVWLDRRARAREAASPSRPSPAPPGPHTATPPAAAGLSPSDTAVRARRSSLRRVR